MKKLLLFALFFMSTPCMADFEDYACEHLMITIRNDTPYTCYLTQTESNMGAFYDQNEVPFKILTGRKEWLNMLQEPFNAGSDIKLYYECGEGQTITLLAKQNSCGTNNKTLASVVAANNMKADYNTSPANYWKNQPATIDWILSLA
ncbi:MAG: hypothetical protein NXI01_00095 [Gammaproteobacteria bacterium]|nr:hypothetical protein [Gammaproteobacteria bacterium]